MENKRKILVVDDEDRNLRLLEAMLLPSGYEVLKADDGGEALRLTKEHSPDLILLDVMMPRMDGFETAKRLKRAEETRIIPIIMVTALKDVEDRVKAFDAGADEFLTKPVDKTELRARVRALLKVKEYNDHMLKDKELLKKEVNKKTKQLRKALESLRDASLDTIFRLSRAAEYKDEDTGAHILRMRHYSEVTARKLGLDKETIEAILYAAPMHDVGKIGIPDSILLKPGKLDADEWEIMKQHTLIGGQILNGSDSDFIQLGEVIALTHHERWDGSGYPEGLKGEDIPVVGRVVAIADVFDALTSKRPYKEPFSIEKSFSIIKESTGTHFDPDVVDAFFSAKDDILLIKDKYRDEDESLLFKMTGGIGK